MLISEVFHAPQGEGVHSGEPSLFVRTSGCNLRCTWCDTPYTSWQPEGTARDILSLLDETDRWPQVRHIVITGGEPGGGLPAVRTRIEEAFGCDVTEAMGLGDVSPSLFGECMAKGGMHFCGQGLVWPELIDLDKGSPIEIEAGAVGELVYTALEREAMPLVRFRSGDIVEIQGTTCECGRTGFRMRCVARVDDMIIVRGVNVYPSAVVGIVAEFKPHVTGRARLVVTGESVAIDPPVLVEVEVPSGNSPPEAVAEAIAKTIRERLIFRARVVFITDGDFGDAGYKTKLLIRK